MHALSPVVTKLHKISVSGKPNGQYPDLGAGLCRPKRLNLSFPTINMCDYILYYIIYYIILYYIIVYYIILNYIKLY